MQQNQIEDENIGNNKLSSSSNNFSTHVTFDDGQQVDDKEKIRLKKLKKIQKRKQKRKQKRQKEVRDNPNNYSILDKVSMGNQQKQQMQIKQQQEIIVNIDTNDNNVKEGQSKQDQVCNQNDMIKQRNRQQQKETKLDDIGFIIYQQQFQRLFNQLNEFVSQESRNAYQQIRKKSILIIGQNQSGRKHLLNQALFKLYCHYLSMDQKSIKLQIMKHFINQQNQYILRNHHQTQQYKQSSSVNLVVNFIDTPNNYQQKQQHLQEQQLHNQASHHLNLVVNAYFITNASYNSEWVNAQNACLIVKLSGITHSTLNHTNSPHIHIHKLQQFLIYSLQQIEQQLNTNKQSHQFTSIQYSSTVITFTIKFLIKKYQQDAIKCCHPILAIRYLKNYLYNHFMAQIKFINHNKVQNQKESLRQQSQYQKPNNQTVTLKLSTPTITTFLNSLLLANRQNPATHINLTSLIFSHQLILISCYLYLTSTSYLNAFYVNAIKLYQYFLIVQQTLTIEKIQEKRYWQGLEKLRDLGLFKFVQDIKPKQQHNVTSRSKRFSNHIKFIKDYKNHNFYLTLGIEKIKQDLQNMKIYAKFFIQQDQE